jgi:hypothetical protein
MHPSRLLTLTAGIVISGGASLAGSPAGAQNEAPFTIRFPPDGATVRETVNVKIPLASIPEGGYVSIYLDGEFRGAIPITPEQRNAIQVAATAAKQPAYFTWTWDTKQPLPVKFSAKKEVPKDGEHEILARLYVPGAGTAAVLKETSSVKINVRNKIDPAGIGKVALKYRFGTGDQRVYNRSGAHVVVAGLSQGFNSSSDQELVSFDTNIAVAVEDRYKNGSAILRNKLNNVLVRQGGQSSYYPSDLLPSALYQEVTPSGSVVYSSSAAAVNADLGLGVPVATALQLPSLPANAVEVGDTWMSRNVSLEIPGMDPAQQPKVQVQSRLEGFEWEGGYPTAKIRQTFDSSKAGVKLPPVINFGGVDVQSPTIKLDQEIFIAYRSGTLVKVNRNLEVVGRTSQAPGGGAGPSMPGMSGPGAGMGDIAGPSMPSGGMTMRPPGGGMRGMGSFGSSSQRPPSGMGSYGSSQRPPSGMGSGGSSSMFQGMRGSYSPGGGMRPPGMAGGIGGSGMVMGGGGAGMAGGMGGDGLQQITLKATTVTELKSAPGAKTASR